MKSDRASEYKQYLLTPEWHAKRAEALLRDGMRCRVCNSAKNLNVHHRQYCKWGSETLDMLTTLCHDCHELFHDNSTLSKPARAPRKPKTPRHFRVEANTCAHCGIKGETLYKAKYGDKVCAMCKDVIRDNTAERKQMIEQFTKEYMARKNPKKHARNLAVKKYNKLMGRDRFAWRYDKKTLRPSNEDIVILAEEISVHTWNIIELGRYEFMDNRLKEWLKTYSLNELVAAARIAGNKYIRVEKDGGVSTAQRRFALDQVPIIAAERRRQGTF